MHLAILAIVLVNGVGDNYGVDRLGRFQRNDGGRY